MPQPWLVTRTRQSGVDPSGHKQPNHELIRVENCALHQFWQIAAKNLIVTLNN
jgi:hypothetical protein